MSNGFSGFNSLSYLDNADGNVGEQMDAAEIENLSNRCGMRQVRYHKFAPRELDRPSSATSHIAYYGKFAEECLTPKLGKNDPIRQGYLAAAKHAPSSGNRTKFFGRKIRWLIAALGAFFSKNRTTYISGNLTRVVTMRARENRPLNNGLGNSGMSSRDASKSFDASDRFLIGELGLGKDSGRTVYSLSERSRSEGERCIDQNLFSDGAPKLSDLKQGQYESSELLSTLAGVLKHDDGTLRIQSIMKDNGDGTVTVRFPDLDIRVSRERLLDEEHRDIFSPGAPWVRVMEKAYIAYQAKKSQSPEDRHPSDVGDDSESVQQGRQATEHQARVGPWDALRHLIVGEGNCSELTHARTALGRSVTRTMDLNPNKEATNQTVLEEIDIALRAGGTVTVKTSETGNWLNRMVNNQTYSILADATQEDSSGNHVEGYMVHSCLVAELEEEQVDPDRFKTLAEMGFAERRNPNDMPRPRPYLDNESGYKRGRGAVFFVAKNDLGKYFRRVAICTNARQHFAASRQNPDDGILGSGPSTPTSTLGDNVSLPY
ncbi:hypothetical protein AB1K70_03425 [Bremerella sp. JC770]|uniref:hypothetical protein n=1 Tax=Bremerella sp. JC770 TaxID=3232137 RepID=UPI003457F070